MIFLNKYNKKVLFNVNTAFVDFPNRLSLTLFFSGCNASCYYCFNKPLLRGQEIYSLADAHFFYQELKNSFEGDFSPGVVLSGGEPTVHPLFFKALTLFHDIPLSLHTNGFKIPEIPVSTFDSVIVGLKTPAEFGESSLPDFIERLRKSFAYYQSVAYKEVRIVEIPEYKETNDQVLHALREELKDYKITWVPKITINED